MPRSGVRWVRKPSRIGRELNKRVAKIEVGVRVLAQTHAARGEAMMKTGAPWTDRTTFARSSLYGRAEDTTIYLGTTNGEYGLFLELGTVHMAPRPIIQPVAQEVAQAYFMDAMLLIKSQLGG